MGKGKRKIGERFIDLVPITLNPNEVYTYKEIAAKMQVSLKTLQTKIPILQSKNKIQPCGFAPKKTGRGHQEILWKLI